MAGDNSDICIEFIICYFDVGTEKNNSFSSIYYEIIY